MDALYLLPLPLPPHRAWRKGDILARARKDGGSAGGDSPNLRARVCVRLSSPIKSRTRTRARARAQKKERALSVTWL